MTSGCAQTGCQCDCHNPWGMYVHHLVACCDKPPALENDRVAMMLGLVPDRRTPEDRLVDAIRTRGRSLEFHYEESNADTRPPLYTLLTETEMAAVSKTTSDQFGMAEKSHMSARQYLDELWKTALRLFPEKVINAKGD